jgi:hypothetical protein
MKTIGSCIFPVVFKNSLTGEKIKMKFYALVVPKLLIPMFISIQSLMSSVEEFEFGGWGSQVYLQFVAGEERVKLLGLN